MAMMAGVMLQPDAVCNGRMPNGQRWAKEQMHALWTNLTITRKLSLRGDGC